MRIQIPARMDGNDALNAFALGIIHLLRLDLAAGGIAAGGPLADLLGVLRLPVPPAIADLPTQETVGAALRAHILAAHPGGFPILVRTQLREAFKSAFLRYCARRFWLPLEGINLPLILRSNVYILEKLNFVTQAFAQLSDLLISSVPTTLQKLKSLVNHPASVAILNAAWTPGVAAPHPHLGAVEPIHWVGITRAGGPLPVPLVSIEIGKIELIDLAINLGFTLDFIPRDAGGEENITFTFPGVVPQFQILLQNDLNHQQEAKASTLWSINFPGIDILPVLARRTYTSLQFPIDNWYQQIRRCYQFLDKIFDDSIFNLNYNNAAFIAPPCDFINFIAKDNFLSDFRNYFPDEPGQIYGWRGLRNWVIRKDIEAREKKLGESLNHTMEEFWIISNMLEALSPANPIITFLNQTSIIRVYTVGPALLANPLQGQLIDIKKTNFIYRTQKLLVEQRYRHARYLEYACDPDKFMMYFHLNLEDHGDQEVIRRLGLCKSSWGFIRWLYNSCRPLWIIAKAPGKRHKYNNNLYTYDSWSKRNCNNIWWLFIISAICIAAFLLAFIIPRILLNENDNTGTRTAYDVMSTISSMLVGIFTLFLGVAMVQGWRNYHHWLHDFEERNVYHKDMAKIFHRTKLCNLMEEIGLDIERSIDINPPAFVHLWDTPRSIHKRKIKEQVKRHLNSPEVSAKIDDTIIEHLVKARDKKNPIEDITEYLGEDLQLKRIRRAYLRWDIGPKIKERLEKKQRHELYRHYGIFKRDKLRRDIDYHPMPNYPDTGYTFEQCYDNTAFAPLFTPPLTREQAVHNETVHELERYLEF